MTTYRITFGFPDWNTTQVFDVDPEPAVREGLAVKEAIREGLRRCDAKGTPVLLKVERRWGNGWDLLTVAHQLQPGTQVILRSPHKGERVVTFTSWRFRRDGLAYLIDEKGTARGGIFCPDDVLTLRPYEEIADEADAKAEHDAEMAYERHLEDAGYEDARAQEDYERSLGITEFL